MADRKPGSSITEGVKATQFLSYLLILAIAFVFVIQWGPGSRGCDVAWREKGINGAAVVNGHEIPLRDFLRQYSAALQNLRLQQNIPESLAKQLGYPKQVLDYMVDRELLAQAAERHGVTASDEEIRDILFKRADFQKDGQFDFDRYREVVRDYYRQTETEFESKLRHDLSAEKMADLVESAAAVSDDEVRARFMKEGNKAEVTYVRFLPAMFAEKVPAPSAATLAQYAKDHEKDISDYYAANKMIYHTPERARLWQILIKVAPDATPEQKAKARAEIDSVKKQLDGGKDFELLAKQVSQDVGSKSRGGDMGMTERSALAPEVADVAFSLKPGDVSQPIESHYGFHVIKVGEKKPAEDKALAEVQDEIAKQLYTREQSRALAQAEASKALAELQAGKKLDELYPPEKKDESASPFNFDVESKPAAVSTGEINAASPSFPKLGPAPALASDVFSRSEPGALPKVYNVGEAAVVADVTVRTKPTDEQFSTQKDTLRAEAVKAKRIELRESFLRGLRKSANIITNDNALDQAGGPSSS